MGQPQDRHVHVSGRDGVDDRRHVNLVAGNVGVCSGPLLAKEGVFFLDLELSIEHPRSLPLLPRLLKQSRSKLFHQNPQVLRFHIWKLSQRALLEQASLKEWRNVLPEANFGSLP